MNKTKTNFTYSKSKRVMVSLIQYRNLKKKDNDEQFFFTDIIYNAEINKSFNIYT